jgi:poly(3-hydroxybutyrate) depolymerase
LLTLGDDGSGRDGKILVEKWKGLAEKSKIIVAGPDATNPQFWSSPVDGPEMLHDLVEQLKKDLPVDPRRVYLFGHSAGGSFALQMGLLQSEYFAAVAVHAGAVHPEGFNLTSFAERKIPFVLVVGARDPVIPAEAVRATRDLLQKDGFIAELTEIPNHTHDYYGRSAFINDRIWTFLQAHALTADPKYKQYTITR